MESIVGKLRSECDEARRLVHSFRQLHIDVFRGTHPDIEGEHRVMIRNREARG